MAFFKRKLTGVSSLAVYADNPVKYVKQRGKPINTYAIQYGNRKHNEAGRIKKSSAFSLSAGTIVLAISVLYLLLPDEYVLTLIESTFKFILSLISEIN